MAARCGGGVLMPINSSSIPALVTAGKVRRRRRRKRRASGGGIFDWSGVSEALPEASNKDMIPDPAFHLAKSMIWDLPHKAINAAKGTSYGLRREDFTDVPPDYSPDPKSPLGGIGINVPKGGWQPTDELIGASLEGATNVMGGTALSAPAKAAGEVIAGSGPVRGVARGVLDMSPEASAVRATEQGFDTTKPVYHGTSKDADFKKFKDSRHGTWTVDDPRIASEYATVNDSQGFAYDSGKMVPTNTSSRVMPLYAKPLENPYIVRGGEDIPESVRTAGNYKAAQSEWFEQLRLAGHDGVQFAEGGVRVDFNNANLRGQFAPFDPKNNGKSVIFGAGAADKRAAALAAADDVLSQEARMVSRPVSVDDLAPEVRTDIANILMERVPALKEYANGRPEDIEALIYGAHPTIEVPHRTVDPSTIDISNRQVSPRAVKNYARMDTEPPPIVMAGDDLIEGGHRVAAGQKTGRHLPAVDISDLLKGDWKGWMEGGELHPKGFKHEPAQAVSTAERPAAPAADPAAVGPGGGGPTGVGGLPEAQATAARWAGERKPLEGLPGALKIGGQHFVPGPIAKIHDVAEDYMRTVHPDRPYTPPTKYYPIDPEHSKAIAQAYEEMKHTPNDPATKASYDALIDETAKQYQAIKKTGLKIEPIPAGAPDPYAANPRLAAIDVAENNHLWFFPTEGGFGTVNKITDNPMLRKTGEKIGDHELLANDMFRVVHDYFGHLKEGHGFRAAGEDNAWRTHAQMYSDLARPAMTTETRGQNSWVNYGPHGEKNRTAAGADTTYADQKVGLMPEWTMRDRGSPEPIIAYHGSPYSFDRFSMDKIGAGEGNQAYGHGLYFAGHSPVSEWYRHQLASRRDPILQKYGLDAEDGASVGMRLAEAGGDVPTTVAALEKEIASLRSDGDTSKGTRNMIVRRRAMVDYLQDSERNPGHMYEVAIDARPEQFLDWDAPLAAQGDIGKRVLEIPEVAKQHEHQTKFLGPDKGLTGASAYAAATKWNRGSQLSPPEGAASRVTDALKRAGVAGIKYLDQASRSMGKGTQNFVAFDDNMVKILRKYGIVGIPAAGVLGVDGEERRATGGSVNAAMEVARAIKRKKGGRVHIGPIVGDTGGRADKVPMSVPDGSYVIPADIVSGLGEGNTGAGMVQLGKMFPKSKPRIMRETPGAVPILAADGEFVVSPESILDRWDDLAYGHQALDAWVLHERQQLIETLEGLAPPAQD
jgi:hypothetical protein